MRSQSKGIGSVDFRVNGLKNPYSMSRYGCLDQSSHHSVGMSSDSCDITSAAHLRHTSVNDSTAREERVRVGPDAVRCNGRLDGLAQLVLENTKTVLDLVRRQDAKFAW